ncbi:MAG: hypothetical protein ABSB94_16965 [Syntrophorhabdales bacterium]|jgi:hypothetical protein
MVLLCRDISAQWVNHMGTPDRKTTVTFETKCYENDWEYLLKADRLKKTVALCRYPFDRVVLHINNVKNPDKVARYASRLLLSGVISEFVQVSDYAREALDSFDCDPESFRGGYYYSIAEMTAIYLCKTDYLLHFSSDTIMANREEWIGSAIRKMEENPEILVANPTWNNKFHRAREESVAEDGAFYIGHGFSDQCYLIAPARFRSPIYNEKHAVTQRNFPPHGGESFEKRIDAYMRNHDYLRITSKRASYRHRNFPRNRLAKLAAISLAIARSRLPV